MEDRAHRAGGGQEIAIARTREWLNPKSRYHRMLELEGDEFTFSITNTEVDPDRTVSLEAMRFTSDLITTWLGTRLYLRMTKAHKSAKKPHLKISIEWED